jgi:hypothetical protein
MLHHPDVFFTIKNKLLILNEAYNQNRFILKVQMSSITLNIGPGKPGIIGIKAWSINFNFSGIEALYKIHGEHPLQNAGKIRIG